MSQRLWTADEEATLVRLYPTHSASEIGALMGRSRASIKARAVVLGLAKGSNSGQFERGHSTWNKGRAYNPGGASVSTRFQPGHRPYSWNPVGHERITKDGYLQRKVADTGVTRHDYVFVHHLVWRAAGREIPAGHALCFIDGDKTRIELDNLELVSRVEMMRRNTIHNLPAPLVEVIRMRAGIVNRINRKERRRGQDAHD